jgi:poly(3-hydroxybutyrate) depolymerase
MSVLIAISVAADEAPSPPAANLPGPPTPLLVVLHGDHENADTRAAKWREAAAAHGWNVLALDCPSDLGCDRIGRWYRWNGDPRWIRDQVRGFAQRVPVDMSRVYLAGWSGGATYIGKRMPMWTPMFAGVVIHGGGTPPSTKDCPDRALPTYFLVGDENPAHGGSQRLRAYLHDCGQELKWDLLPGANHDQEDEALTPQKANEILRWLASRRRIDAWS